MLAIRMQRTGRKGHAMFRIVVQDSRRTPTSGKVVTYLGSFDPHAKKTTLNKEKAAFYLEHGAQPTPRIVRIFKEEKIKLPAWVEEPAAKEKAVKNPEKRRSTAPKTEQPAPEEVVEKPTDEPADNTSEEQPTDVAETETPQIEQAADEAPADEA